MTVVSDVLHCDVQSDVVPSCAMCTNECMETAAMC